MQSKVIALLASEGGREATLLVRRGNGEFALARIDARVARAARLADRFAFNARETEISFGSTQGAAV